MPMKRDRARDEEDRYRGRVLKIRVDDAAISRIPFCPWLSSLLG